MASPQSPGDKAFAFAQDLVKQVITLSVGIITITITFVKDFIGDDAPHGAKMLLALSWLFYIAAVLFGIWTLMALTGSFAKGGTSINASNMRLPATLHLLSFVVGLGFTIAAGWWAL